MKKGIFIQISVLNTAELLIESLGIKEHEYLVCFQSRFGKLEWMKPYLDETLAELPSKGIKNVQSHLPRVCR